MHVLYQGDQKAILIANLLSSKDFVSASPPPSAVHTGISTAKMADFMVGFATKWKISPPGVEPRHPRPQTTDFRPQASD